MEKINESFSSFTEEQQRILIEENINFIVKIAIDWENVLINLMNLLKEKVKSFSFENLEIEIGQDNKLVWKGDLRSVGIIGMLNEILKKENKDYDLLWKAKKAYEMFDEISELNHQRNIKHYNGREDKFIKEYFILSRFVKEESKRRRIQIIFENAQTDNVKKMVKQMKTQILYGAENIDDELDLLIKNFFNDNIEICTFKSYIKNEIERITKELNEKVEKILSTGSLIEIMKNNDTIVFDNNGVATLKSGNYQQVSRIIVDNHSHKKDLNSN